MLTALGLASQRARDGLRWPPRRKELASNVSQGLSESFHDCFVFYASASPVSTTAAACLLINYLCLSLELATRLGLGLLDGLLLEAPMKATHLLSVPEASKLATVDRRLEPKLLAPPSLL